MKQSNLKKNVNYNFGKYPGRLTINVIRFGGGGVNNSLTIVLIVR